MTERLILAWAVVARLSVVTGGIFDRGAVWSLVLVAAERADSARTGTTVVMVVLLIADIGFS